MRIAIDGRMIGWTGIGRYTRHLLTELAAIDEDTHYTVLLGEDDGRSWRAPGPNFEAMRVDAPPYRLQAQWRMTAAVRQAAPDLVHFVHFAVPVACRVPFVVTIHDLTMQRFRNFGGASPLGRLRNNAKMRASRAVVRSAVRHARHVIVPSHYVASDLVERFGHPHGGITVTREAADLLAAAAEPVAGVEGRHFLLYVGHTYPHKNLGVVVEAVARLASRPVDLCLVVAGPEDEFQAELRAAVGSGPLADRVLFPGFVSDGQLAWLYEHAACFVFPSLSEGFGLPGLEAMAHGVPVAAARTSSLPEIYGEAAAWFDPSDPADLAAAVSAVLDAPERREELVRAGRARAASFSWRTMAEETLECYRAAVSLS